MPNPPKPSNFVASIIAIMMVLGVWAFILGIGAGTLKYEAAQFALIAGFLFGAVSGSILGFYYGGVNANQAAARRQTDYVPPGGASTTTVTAPADPPASVETTTTTKPAA